MSSWSFRCGQRTDLRSLSEKNVTTCECGLSDQIDLSLAPATCWDHWGWMLIPGLKLVCVKVPEPWRHVTRCPRRWWCAVPLRVRPLRAWAEWGRTRWPGCGGTSCWLAPSQPRSCSRDRQDITLGRTEVNAEEGTVRCGVITNRATCNTADKQNTVVELGICGWEREADLYCKVGYRYI